MSRVLFYISVSIFSLFSFNTLAQISPKVHEVDPCEFMDKIMDENNHLLIDVRPGGEYRKYRIPGAINVPNSKILNSILDTMDLDRPVLLYCRYGDRSHTAAVKALSKYDVQFYNLKGGLKAWEREHFTLSRKRIKKI